MYDLIVIGAGHAGCEAALAAARMGVSTLLLTLDMNSVALMPCNPAIGGTGKGHLVRELDALGGQMGLCIDRTFLQSRMLNRGKGPAVHSLRAQADKRRYHEDMMATLFSTDHLTIRQGEAMELLTQNGAISGVRTMTGEENSLPGGGHLQRRISEKPHHHRSVFQKQRAAGASAGGGAFPVPDRSWFRAAPFQDRHARPGGRSLHRL